MSEFSPCEQAGSETTFDARTKVLNVRVPRASLRNAVGNGLSKRGRVARMLRLQTHVYVEADPDDRADSVFYTPFAEDEHDDEDSQSHSSGTTTSASNRPSAHVENSTKASQPRRRPPASTELVLVDPTSTHGMKNLAYTDDDFEVSFIGMNVPPQDTIPSDGNELLLYSLRSHIFPDEESDDSDNDGDRGCYEGSSHVAQRSPFAPLRLSDVVENTDNATFEASRTKANRVFSSLEAGTLHSSSPDVRQGGCGGQQHQDDSSTSKVPHRGQERCKQTHEGGSETVPLPVADPNGINLLPTDVPLIHYDPVIDGHGTGTQPDSFLPVPASKAVFRQHRAHSHATLLPVRFTVMEIDRVTSAQARAVTKVDSINGFASHLGVAVPYADIISAAVNVANAAGARALRKYARPDLVISKDIEFRIASRTIAEAGRQDTSNNSQTQHDHLYPAAYLRVSCPSSPPIIIAFGR